MANEEDKKLFDIDEISGDIIFPISDGKKVRFSPEVQEEVSRYVREKAAGEMIKQNAAASAFISQYYQKDEIVKALAFYAVQHINQIIHGLSEQICQLSIKTLTDYEELMQQNNPEGDVEYMTEG